MYFRHGNEMHQATRASMKESPASQMETPSTFDQGDDLASCRTWSTSTYPPSHISTARHTNRSEGDGLCCGGNQATQRTEDEYGSKGSFRNRPPKGSTYEAPSFRTRDLSKPGTISQLERGSTSRFGPAHHAHRQWQGPPPGVGKINILGSHDEIIVAQKTRSSKGTNPQRAGEHSIDEPCGCVVQ
eukprot:gnl/MRDRNA2_/MRDRNA2_128207_c0_seq1.p1 gnl/MRDRNA2_/MRDRNA2_128207_c0~~gnl/MRDRNA2_/MRDRNA2_128207_c0_seq1.p1  ORF type:complete len:186 (-),score=21.16 gnl/MRDRNA2_/MRDRNA2_128207_c0_seq1:21-578(-)